MKLLSSEKGLTLLELLIAISLILILISTILPTVIQFREREINWRKDIQLEQEAIRFFTYLENRNSSILDWSIAGNSVTIRAYKMQSGPIIKRNIYKDGARIVEVDSMMGGYLILAQMVENIRYYEIGDQLHIELILTSGGRSRVFQGVLSKSINL